MTDEVMAMEKLLTAGEAAEILAVSPAWMYRAAKAGTFPYVQVGRNVRFRPADVQEFISRGGGES